MSMRIDDSGSRGSTSRRRPSGGGSFATITRNVAPRRTVEQSVQQKQMMAPPAPAPAPMLGGGGGGGMGGGAAAPAPRPPSMNLEDFIQNHFLKRQTENENARALEDFDAETLRMRQQTEGDMEMSRQDLQRDMDDMGLENAGSFAARGLDRSGLVFQGQDRINEEGQRRGMQIQEMLTSLLGSRGQGRIQQQRSGEQLLNQRIAELTRQFNEQNQAPLAV